MVRANKVPLLGLIFLYSLFLLTGLSSWSGAASRGAPKSHHLLPVIIDMDPAMGVIQGGKPRDIDDALALVEALNTPKIQLRGVTVVFGNTSLEHGMKVARKIMRLKQAKVSVYEGALGPLKSTKNIEVNPAVRFMAESLRQENLTIVALGPLTNVASVIQNYPFLKNKIRRVVVVMGRKPGHSFYIGKKGPLRDFNYVKDPLAAKILLTSGVPVTLLPFELSSQVLITSKHLDQIKKRRTPIAKFVYQASQVWSDHWSENFPSELGFHPWDSVALAYLNDPHFFRCQMRGFRFEEGLDSAHGVGHAGTGKKMEKQPWLVFSPEFSGKKQKYCFSFAQGQKKIFVKKMLKRLY